MNKTAMITGARGGIGKSMCKKFAEAGYNIAACTRNENTEFSSFLTNLEKKCQIKAYQAFFDMTDFEAMKQEYKRIVKEAGTIDVLINNAGVAHGGLFAMTTIETIKNVFEVNLFAQMQLAQLVLRGMTRQKAGVVINMASVAALNVRAGNSAYGVSKAALKAFTETIAVEYAPLGIRINAIAPSLTDTKMAKFIEEKAGAEMLVASAMKRLARPEEIADTAVWLASSRASFINGQTILVNGGGQPD